ncbi:DUF3793 family protein [Lacrimispora indolis]|uniref:DUF3793 family protein n=1 Tax=Lacrimispora indolis TaxID=69825 RepID=UPI00040D95F5|nr:DUF3793 family protein [[Clostridium] methoxybenzovorans]
MLLEKNLIEYCSPTLASLKTASLFNHPFSSEEELEDQLAGLNSQLEGKGISLLVLCRRRNKALIYVCRKSRLQADLSRPEVGRFLKAYGYGQMEVEAALNRLKERLNQEGDFPHEIGVFLGYPLEDVVGFIQNGGKNSKCTGYWKVYADEREAALVFARYRKCRTVYAQLWQNGRTVWQLTVASSDK